MDLSSHLKNHEEELANLPVGVHSLVVDSETMQDLNVEPGVLFCLRSENTKVAVDSTYSLAPHYLVFVSNNGEILLNFPETRRILEVFKKLALGRAAADIDADESWTGLTRGGSRMEPYQELLAKAVSAITGRPFRR